MHFISGTTECLKFMYTLLETLFFSKEMRQKYICVVFYSLNLRKLAHVQNFHLLPDYTPNNDVSFMDDSSGDVSEQPVT